MQSALLAMFGSSIKDKDCAIHHPNNKGNIQMNVRKKMLVQNNNKKLILNVGQKERNLMHMSRTLCSSKAGLTHKELPQRKWENSSGVVEILK